MEQEHSDASLKNIVLWDVTTCMLTEM